MAECLAETLNQNVPKRRKNPPTSTASVPPEDPEQYEQNDDQNEKITVNPVVTVEKNSNAIPEPLENAIVPVEKPSVPINLDQDWLDTISDNNLVEALTQIESISQNLNQQPSKQNINVSNIANIQKNPMLPGMYFPNSTVTINYNRNGPNY